ncbi:MAG: hypothetical protein PHX21_07550 [bacterium]|nr:hypothetical protein [bacterium]
MAIIKRDEIIIEGEQDIGLSQNTSNEKTNESGLQEPGITINKANGIVHSIDIICTCGRKIHIVCEYEEKPKT